MAALMAQHGPLPVTATVLTGGGGMHYDFAAVPGVPSRAGIIGPGVDVRSDSGYVLLPPSNHISGGVYRDDPDAPLATTPRVPMPAWLLALATASTNGTAPPPRRTRRGTRPRSSRGHPKASDAPSRYRSRGTSSARASARSRCARSCSAMPRAARRRPRVRGALLRSCATSRGGIAPRAAWAARPTWAARTRRRLRASRRGRRWLPRRSTGSQDASCARSSRTAKPIRWPCSAHVLVAAGNIIGDGPHVLIEKTRHPVSSLPPSSGRPRRGVRDRRGARPATSSRRSTRGGRGPGSRAGSAQARD